MRAISLMDHPCAKVSKLRLFLKLEVLMESPRDIIIDHLLQNTVDLGVVILGGRARRPGARRTDGGTVSDWPNNLDHWKTNLSPATIGTLQSSVRRETTLPG